MRVPALILLALATGGACKKAKDHAPGAAPNPPASTATQDALWGLAPDGAMLGIVVSPTGLERIEAGWADVSKVLAASPDLAEYKAQIDQEITEVMGSPNLSFAAAGMSPSKGLAVFVVPGERPVVILPVTDRDKFLAMVKGQKGTDADTIKKGTCKTVKGVYACARSPEMFDRLGKGTLKDQLTIAGARGDIEVAGMPGNGTEIGAVVQLARGTAVVRGGVKNVPAEAKPFIANAKPRSDGDKTAGFAMLNIAPVLAKLGPTVPPEPIVPGVTASELVKTIAGPLTLTIGNAATNFDLQLPLTDGAVAQKLLDQCDKFPLAPMMNITVKDGVCHVPIPQMQMELDAWIDGKTLHLGKKGTQAQFPSSPRSKVGEELASGDWAVVMFGRGTILGPLPMPMPVPPGAMPREALLGMRAIVMLNEIGFGVRADGDIIRVLATVRTAWANPDDVVTKLVAIKPEDILAGKAGPAGKAIADASPKSPFAADYATGYGGLMIPTAMVGVLAAVAVPAFLDYTKKAKRPEAMLQLNKIAKNAKVAFITNSEFPKGSVAAGPSCCDAGGKCAPGTWTDPVWQALDFQIDEPHLFRYSYESKDGQSFVAKAVGDLDCDGTEITYEVQGTVENGNPRTEIIEPQPNTD